MAVSSPSVVMRIIHDIAVNLAESWTKQTNSDEDTKLKVAYSLEFILKIVSIGLAIYLMSKLLFDENSVKSIWGFIIAFLPIRLCFGGFHLKSDNQCFLLTVSVTIISGLLSTIVQFNLESIIVIYLFGALIIKRLGVVDNEVKRLSDKKKAMYMKRGLVSFGVIFVIHMAMLYMGNDIMSNAMALGLIVGFGNLLLGE